ncbi:MULTISPECIES: glycosyltransferase [unclassified Paenibacillus]|uniref:glycosyltransferase family 2 protein n=1 Tax=unclassified Paenibacillus TaxID=185978 RepID=UPI002782CB71|nr:MULTISPECIES: glycosyltransferase [unclassified Paenibacillus]MDQ0901551.1 teichuronic acid biosynthesis glycosyltransferase TuaG [Paenibacillus sp. V4I7]MDQ0919946.1 teichuronic acid biosynthesis glycosyltransferase TuaG [Paenibacillus sp. V4I5]
MNNVIKVPKVSVIIPFYNCPYIGHAIISATNQTYPNVEVIVVDDGSNLYVEKIKPYMDRIRYIRKSNGGTGSALNQGIKEAKGEFIAWLSSDDLFLPNKIARQMQFMQQVNASISYTNWHALNEHNHIFKQSVNLVFPNIIAFYSRFLVGNPINGCTVILKKGLIPQIGWFDQSFLYTQDYDMWLRLLVEGQHFHFLNEPLTLYRIHDEMGTKKHYSTVEEEMWFIQQKYKEKLTKLIEKLK